MKRGFYISMAIFLVAVSNSFISVSGLQDEKSMADSLRRIYSRSSDRWPAPVLDSGIAHIELDILPDSPLGGMKDSLRDLIRLGKTLFFDPRLSGSNQISCSSCHVPDMHWTDGRRIALGHDHKQGSRNTPSIQNVWFNDRLFWDGRALSLEQQARGPIISPIEMHQDIKKLPTELKKIKGYRPMFQAAYGTPGITEDRITYALSVFQRTIVSRNTSFDFFMAGASGRLTDQQILGLHLFRTKARCLNCHNGPMLTDNQFHNLGETYYGDKRYQDLGLYNTTKNPDDVGKFKTPGLRNTSRTGPWFHHGLYTSFLGMMNVYISGLGDPRPIMEQARDPLFPKKSPHLIDTGMTDKERDALIAFLEALSTDPVTFEAPLLPQ